MSRIRPFFHWMSFLSWSPTEICVLIAFVLSAEEIGLLNSSLMDVFGSLIRSLIFFVMGCLLQVLRCLPSRKKRRVNASSSQNFGTSMDFLPCSIHLLCLATFAKFFKFTKTLNVIGRLATDVCPMLQSITLTAPRGTFLLATYLPSYGSKEDLRGYWDQSLIGETSTTRLRSLLNEPGLTCFPSAMTLRISLAPRLMLSTLPAAVLSKELAVSMLVMVLGALQSPYFQVALLRSTQPSKVFSRETTSVLNLHWLVMKGFLILVVCWEKRRGWKGTVWCLLARGGLVWSLTISLR